MPGAVIRGFSRSPIAEPSRRQNLRPWRVHAVAGEPLAELKTKAMAVLASGLEKPEYDVYPPELWDPFHSRRFICGEEGFATIRHPARGPAGADA